MSTEQAYRAKFAISQSSIKDWKELPPQKWYDKWILKKGKFKRSDALDFGSLLDTLCFSPDQYDRRFLVSDTKKPSDKVTAIVTAVFEHIKALNQNAKDQNDLPAENGKEKIIIPFKNVTLVDNKDVVAKYTVELEHYTDKPDQAYNDVVKKGSDYFELLKKAGKRVIISKTQEALAKELKDILFTDKTTALFFTPKKDCEIFFQVQIFAEFPIEGIDGVETIPIKGMLDIVFINKRKKTAREVDLKFTNDAFKFNDYKGPVRMFDYPGQHSFYDALLPEWLATFRDGEFKDYAIQNPINVVIDDDLKVPYIYEYNKTDLHIRRHGIENTSIRGWEDTLQDIAWHLDKNDWSRPKEHLLHGKMLINIFKK